MLERQEKYLVYKKSPLTKDNMANSVLGSQMHGSGSNFVRMPFPIPPETQELNLGLLGLLNF